MSFKRDGDDSSLLKTFMSRRVSELLGEHIPEDEARLLSNGRFICTVCYSRPIFDTINVLSIHRKSKKHRMQLYENFQHLKHKKLKEEHSLKNGKHEENITGLETKQSISDLIFPRSKKKSNKYERKPTLELTNTSETNTKCLEINVQKSETAEVRKYLKSLARKKPFIKTVVKLRENNVPEESPHPKQPFSGSKKVVPERSRSLEVENYLRMKETGWIQNAAGIWVKDPNVEFDSDDEDILV